MYILFILLIIYNSYSPKKCIDTADYFGTFEHILRLCWDLY